MIQSNKIANKDITFTFSVVCVGDKSSPFLLRSNAFIWFDFSVFGFGKEAIVEKCRVLKRRETREKEWNINYLW